jgi:hypothetical protein
MLLMLQFVFILEIYVFPIPLVLLFLSLKFASNQVTLIHVVFRLVRICNEILFDLVIFVLHLWRLRAINCVLLSVIRDLL